MEELKVIAHIRTDFPEKFGIPRQSGLVPSLIGRIVFEKEFRNPDYIKGIEEFRYLWILWGFEDVARENMAATVRPPRLGGNETRGVFATRSPFRPNSIGLSSVKLLGVEKTKEGYILVVGGADCRDNTPIYDIKPYLSYVDSHAEAGNGFASLYLDDNLEVEFPTCLLERIAEDKRDAVIGILREDPRPHYIENSEREYGITFAEWNIRFKVEGKKLRVLSVEKC